MIHLYTAKSQPAVNFINETVEGDPMRFTFPSRRLFCCQRCGRPRWAKNLSVQVFYDGVRFFCTDKTKCKK